MDNATVRISAGLRLGAPVVRPHSCVCKQRLQLMAITVSLAVVVLVVTAATIRSTICFAVYSRVMARFLLVSLIHCVPQVKNAPMVLH